MHIHDITVMDLRV